MIELLGTSLGDVLDLLTKAGISLESDRLKPVLSTAESIARKVGNKDRLVIRNPVQVIADRRQVGVQLSVEQFCQALGIKPETPTPDCHTLVSPVAHAHRAGIRPVQQNGRSV